MNYLELCQDFVKEFGVAGGTGPAMVSGNTGEAANVARWIADADVYIQNLWVDWRFLWREYEEVIPVSATLSPVHGVSSEIVRAWDRRSLFLDKATDTWTRLPVIDYEDFRGVHDVGVRHSGQPSIVAERPDSRLAFDVPTDKEYTLSAAFWKCPSRMTSDASVSPIPANYHRLIVVRAAIMYGNREDAPEIIAGAEAEYMDLLDKLESTELPSRRANRMSSSDEDIQMEIPGY